MEQIPIKIKDIRSVEIEIHSYCNRTCSWCPNSVIDRHTQKYNMDETIFKKLIDELADNYYHGVISFSRYNEPLSDKELLNRRIAYINEKLPGIKTVANTNGDFGFTGTNIDELTVMDYDNEIPKEDIDVPVNIHDTTVMTTKLTGVGNRGGSLKNIKKAYKRNMPCFEPMYFVGVDYTGDITPCCNIRHDVKEHKPFILGNIYDNKLEEILNSEPAKQFRWRAASGNPDYLPLPCQGCDKAPGRYTRNNPGIEK